MSYRDKLNVIFKDKKRLVGIILLAVLGLLLIISSASSDKGDAQTEQTLDEYKRQLEGELTDICSSVEGVGKCRVMISFERGAENTYKGSSLVGSKPPKVMGVSIVCSGGDSSQVRSRLCELVSALFGIGANRVSVAKLEN
ncbi:MAG: hypothetical protein IJD51_03860 [Clostridia bacterium]|nr:hypothetical protein [Clostridia bacterium]